ncbi:MAG: efflux RND transporter periplasmic adaptor subunit [bacterium]|nr:efflux RND transporter periplasmic adaptor subunit [bacterium]
MSFIKSLWIKLTNNKKKIILVIIVAIVATGLLTRNQYKDDGMVAGEETFKEVTLVSVSELSQNLDPLPLIGKVSSSAQVEIQAEASGQIITVFAQEGDILQPGQVIAQINSSSQQTALSAALAGVNSARANYDKARLGARSKQVASLQISLNNAVRALEDSNNSGINAFKSAFSIADDVVRGKTDVMFTAPQSANPQLDYRIVGHALERKVESQRVDLEKILTDWKEKNDTLESLASAQTNLTTISDYLNNLANLTNPLLANGNLTQSTIDGWKLAISTSRININTAIASVSSAKSSIGASMTAKDLAQNALDLTLAGASPQDLDLARSGLDQASAALKSAQINLEKTAIKSPIAGTLTRLDIERGDQVNIFASVAEVADVNSLKITTFITENDRQDIATGNRALIENIWQGKVANIAPAVDPKTKKTEVTVLTNNGSELVNGQSVSLKIDRKSKSLTTKDNLFVPISALKIEADRVVVLGVNQENKLEAYPVQEGPLLGSKVLIEKGLSPETRIVIDARGLRVGQEVIVK